MKRMRSRRCVSLLALVVVAGCPASDTTRETAPDTARSAKAGEARTAQASSWYDRVRAIDLTGDGELDTVRLVAAGERPDSLQVSLTFVVDGAEEHRESWGSSYELALVDSAVRRGAEAGGILRARLDSVLASVVVQPFSAPGVRVMAEDSATLAGLDPRPTHRVSFSYGYESTTRLVWDAPRARFVRLWSCC